MYYGTIVMSDFLLGLLKLPKFYGNTRSLWKKEKDLLKLLRLRRRYVIVLWRHFLKIFDPPIAHWPSQFFLEEKLLVHIGPIACGCQSFMPRFKNS